MHAPRPFPPLRRVSPGTWTALVWFVGVALAFLTRIRMPGEWEPAIYPGVYLYRWDGLVVLALATAMTVAGCRLLRRRPLGALTLVLLGAATAATTLSVAEIPLAQFAAADVAVCFIAATRPRRAALVAAAMALGTLAGYLSIRLAFGWAVGTSTELTVALTVVVACLVGDSARQARDHADESRAQAATQAVTAERLRIARELHDMVAHSIGVIALQAGAARRVIDTQPDRARDALGAVETASRETLSGLRRMLGALRQAERTGGSPERAEAPGLADVDTLARTTAAAGVRVDLRWSGERRPLPPEVDLSGYRIIQESVANVVRHAGTSACQVSIDCQDEELSIEVVDGGPGHASAEEPGYGLVGMRERVALLRGEFSAAPRPEGGFRVAARLPVPAGVR